MKRILLFIMLVTSTICSAYPVQSIGFLNDQGAEKVVNATNPLPITNSSGNSAIASTTLAITDLALQIASNTLNAIAAIASTAANTNVTISTITASLAAGTHLIGKVNTNSINGYAASITMTVGSTTAVIVPTLPAGTKKIYVCTDQKINMGGSDIATTATGLDFIPANAPAWEIAVGTTTTTIYFRAQTATATVNIKPALEP